MFARVLSSKNDMFCDHLVWSHCASEGFFPPVLWSSGTTHTLTSTLRAGGFITWLSALVLVRTDLVNTSNNWISRGFCTLERHERSKNWHFNYSSQHWFVPQPLNQLSSVTGRIKESVQNILFTGSCCLIVQADWVTPLNQQIGRFLNQTPLLRLLSWG